MVTLFSGGALTTDTNLATPQILNKPQNVIDTVVPSLQTEIVEDVIISETSSIWSRLRYGRIVGLLLILAVIIALIWYFVKKI